MLCSAWDHCRSSQSGWSTAFLSESESHKSKLSLPASLLLTLGSGDAHNNQATRNRGSPSINSFWYANTVPHNNFFAAHDRETCQALWNPTKACGDYVRNLFSETQ